MTRLPSPEGIKVGTQVVGKPITIPMGEHDIQVVPQKWARLAHLLSGDDLQNAVAAQDAGGVAALGGAAYRILGILVPDVARKIPEWEFNGFASQDAFLRGEYDEDKDRGPTTAEIAAAFLAFGIVSGGQELGKVLGTVAQMQRLTPQLLAKVQEQNGEPTQGSPNLPGPNGASRSTSTGAPSPTAPES